MVFDTNKSAGFILSHKIDNKMHSSKIFLRLSIFAGLLALLAFVAMPKTNTEHQPEISVEEQAGLEAVQGVSGLETSSDSKSFQAFLSRFPKAKFPMRIEEAQLLSYHMPQNAQERAKRKPYTIEEQYEVYAPFINEHKFSRMAAEGHYEYVALLSQQKDHIVVLCAQVYKSFDWEERMLLMVSYNAQGEILSLQNVASLNGLYGFTTATIQKNLRVESKSYKYMYEKNAEEHGYNNNPRLGTELVEIKHYRYDKSAEAPFLKELEGSKVQVSNI
jgi:hypothetical protein